ncbi:Uncharacterised protein [Burkholderia pseudomallei]|nr:Uncharacterised protein [Burkholderia pseudomallei]
MLVVHASLCDKQLCSYNHHNRQSNRTSKGLDIGAS